MNEYVRAGRRGSGSGAFSAGSAAAGGEGAGTGAEDLPAPCGVHRSGARKTGRRSAPTETGLDQDGLAHWIQAGEPGTVHVIAQARGWGVGVRLPGAPERVLTTTRGAAQRHFGKFETLVGFLQGLGLVQYEVDATGFDARALQTQRARPDAAALLRGVFAAQARAGDPRASE